MSNHLFKSALFELSDKDSGIKVDFTFSDLESMWRITEKRNISLHRKLDDFIERWTNRRL